MEDNSENAQHKRPSWNEYFMKLALLVSERSTCIRRHVGAILVKDKQILSTGYNGAPSGVKDCLILGCWRDAENVPSGKDKHICRATHAEQNAIVQAAKHGIPIKGSTMYVTHDMCTTCARLVINAGIKKVITCSQRKEADFAGILQQAGVEFVRMDKPDPKINELIYRTKS